jgi:hypothetical protein
LIRWAADGASNLISGTVGAAATKEIAPHINRNENGSLTIPAYYFNPKERYFDRNERGLVQTASSKPSLTDLSRRFAPNRQQEYWSVEHEKGSPA